MFPFFIWCKAKLTCIKQQVNAISNLDTGIVLGNKKTGVTKLRFFK